MLHYKGPFQRVSIVLPTGREAEVAKGHDIDLSDDEYGLTAAEAAALEKGLLKQEDSWSDKPDEPKKPDVKSAKKED